MNVENTVDSGDATQTTPDVSAVNPEIAVLENPDGQEPQVKPVELTPVEKENQALKRRIDRLTGRKYELEGQVRNLQQKPAEQRAEPLNVDPAELDKYVDQRAREIARGSAMNDKLDQVEATVKKSVGTAVFNDFTEDLRSYGNAAGVLLESLLELDDSAPVMTHLVNDRAEFDKVIAMSEKKQAIYLGKLSSEIKAVKPRPVSGAPKPLTPVGAGAKSFDSGASNDDDLMQQLRNLR